jgi:hypothetical protein
MGGLWVPHRREDVACNVASAGNSCFQLSLPASDFLLPTSSTSCFRLRLPTGVGSWAAEPPGENVRPCNVGCADHGWIVGAHRREDVACNVASAGNSCFQLSLPASDFLLPTSSTSCFRLRLPTGVGAWAAEPPGAKTFRPLQRGVRGSWVDCGCPTGVKTLRATSHRQGIHASNFHFLLPPSCFRLPPSCFRLRLPTGVGYGRRCRPGRKHFAPYNEVGMDHGWIVGAPPA